MVKEIKAASKHTSEVIHRVSVLAAIVSGSAAAVKLASEPMVQTGFGRQLPIWQAVAAVLIVLVFSYIWKLEAKENR